MQEGCKRVVGAYSGVREVQHQGSSWRWTGLGEVAPAIFEAEIAGDQLEPVMQRERFRPADEVLDAMRAAGLQVLAAYGMSEANGKILLSEPLDEDRDYKLVFIGARDDRPG